MNFRLLGVLASTALATVAAPALAQQQDEVLFRVPLDVDNPTPAVEPVWMWQEDVSACSNTCGTGTRSTTYQCQNAADFDFMTGDFGAPEPTAQCEAAIGPAPADSSTSCTNYSGCVYDWVRPSVSVTVHPIGTNPVGRAGCGDVQRTYDPRCERGDGTVLAAEDHGFCRNDLPDYNDVANGVDGALGYDRRQIETDQCNTSDHEWRTGDWSAPSSTCSDAAVFTRSVICYRKFDSTIQADSACASPKPDSTKVEGVYSTCSWTAIFGDWTAWNSECSSSATRTRTVQCQRSDGSMVSLSACTAQGVAVTPTTETAARYGGCTYSRVNPSAWSAWSSTCSSSAERSRTYQCRRSDGTIVADSECTTRGIDLSETETSAQYGSCTYSAQFGSWSAWSSTCSSTAFRTRAVSCRRSDGTTVADSECTNRGIALTPTTETSGQYGGCTYSAQFGAWSAWSSTCSASATRTRTAACRRSDGAIVANTECTNRGISLSPTSETSAQYGGCSYSWNTGAWSAWSSTCSSTATQTRSVTCRRSDGTTVADSYCSGAGTKPASSQTSAQYGGCTYAWYTGAWSAWSSTCSSTATQTRSVTCRRSDGATVADSYCSGAGTKPASSQTSGQYGGCTYSAQFGAWSAWSSTCSASATRTRTAACRRSDGAIVANTECTNRGISLSPTSETSAQYGGCSYSWNTGAWSAWSSTCSSTATQTRSVTCRRSDGATVADSYCSGAGTKPASSQTSAQYGGCTYSAQFGAWSAWSSTCSSSATRTRTVACLRSDGTIVANTECTNRGISLSPTSETSAQYGGCTYSTSYGSWSACSSGSQTRSITCTRSDGVQVPSSNCGFSGSPTTESQSCTSTVTLWLVYQNTATVPCGGSPTGGSSITNTSRNTLDRQASYQEVYDYAPSITRCIVERMTLNQKTSSYTYTFSGYTGDPVPVVYPMSTPQQITVNQ